MDENRGLTMHEILFRGKRTDNGEWVYGYYTKARYYLNGEEMHIIFAPDVEAFPHCEFTGYEEVLPETVGQYTGLTDKNGVRIFEGDILTIENEGVYAAIKYNESNAAFYVEDEDHEDYLGEAWETDVIIIGNIHDNPEILKGGEENG